jgi:tellurite resistance protein
MTDENLINNLNDFNYELAMLLHRSELHKPEVAAALVTMAVMLAASDGCDPVEQGEAIFGFVERAISRLADLTDPEQVRH